MSIGILALTKKGLSSGLKIQEALIKNKFEEDLSNENPLIYVPLKLKSEAKDKEACKNIVFYEEKFSKILEKAFYNHSHLIFIMATGIVVRSISKHIGDKLHDPAVLVADENLDYMISLLGGHVGGANELTRHLSRHIGCEAVITTATDVNKVGAVDIIAKKLDAIRPSDKEFYTEINSLLAEKENINLYSDMDLKDYNIDTRGFKEVRSKEDLKDKTYITHISPFDYSLSIKDLAIRENQVLIKKRINDFYDRDFLKEDFELILDILKNKDYFRLVPRCISIGIGCKRETPFEEINLAFETLMDTYGLEKKSIKGIYSIELKKDEAGIIKLSNHLNVPFVTFSSDEILYNIDKMKELSGSSFVESITGVKAVAEPCAYIASNGRVIVPKAMFKGITLALGWDF